MATNLKHSAKSRYQPPLKGSFPLDRKGECKDFFFGFFFFVFAARPFVVTGIYQGCIHDFVSRATSYSSVAL